MPPLNPRDAGAPEPEPAGDEPSEAAARSPCAPRQWRSLDELAGAPDFRERLQREFPAHAESWPPDVDRRAFLRLAAASLSLAGLPACTKQPAEAIVPYRVAPERMVTGVPASYATALLRAGHALGVLVESHAGRPTKVEGNPAHPASLGATDAVGQAQVLDLYDPDRSQVVREDGAIATWERFVAALRPTLQALGAQQGRGLALLTGSLTSPTAGRLLDALQQRFPGSRRYVFEPCGEGAAQAAARAAFGRPVQVAYELSRARVLAVLGGDPFTEGPAAVRHQRDVFARRDDARPDEWTRLYVVQSTPTPAGAAADHRLALPPSQVLAAAAALAAALGAPGAGDASDDALPARVQTFVAALAADLREHAGACAVVPGPSAPAPVHVLAHACNAALGNLGTTVRLLEPVELLPPDGHDLPALVQALRAGEVELLLVLDANPVYAAPAALSVAEALAHARLVVHAGSHVDETAALARWHVPLRHALEDWGDARAFDGTLTLQQPLVAPLYEGRSGLELLALLAGEERPAYELVRATWAGSRGPFPGSEAAWVAALHDGVVPDSASPPVDGTPDPRAVAAAAAAARAPLAGDGLELHVPPDPFVHDGRFANNAWLQECPRPVTTLTWDNAALLAPADAARLGLANEDVVRLRSPAGEVEAPVWIVPGQAPGCVTLHRGHGRRRGGRVARGVGVDTAALRPADEAAVQVALERTGRRAELAPVQQHLDLDAEATASEQTARRELVRQMTLAGFAAGEALAHGAEGEPPSLHAAAPREGHAWGMVIDLARCTGCNVCVLACQAENNVPVVGKEQVRRGRAMHWLRVDRSYEGDLHDPAIHSQPVPCMHCEQAPCEVVCPVAATVHSDEGLNDMVYNRCVGTRYCSNNCPYKVRRFNFLNYAAPREPVLELLANPDVTVRSRGVMEKCTYCVQRIEGARAEARRRGRPIADGDVVPACAQACPSAAIVFGDLADAGSRVSAARASRRDYALLGHLGTSPRTTYLARLRHGNPALEERR